MQIGFHGAARTVTGSKYLLTLDHYRLLVDCGLFQGGFEMHQRNWKGLPFRASSVDDVLFTHAHIDHTGYFPRLAADGFSGRAFATPPTKALLGVLLPDSGGLQEEEARWANKKGYSRHQPARPLYTEEDANRSLALLNKLEFERETPLHKHLKVTLHRAGHILGAAGVRLEVGGRSIRFTGDLGRAEDPVMHSPRPLEPADVLVMEATYGDRLHSETDVAEVLADVITRVTTKGGVVLIPAFAVGRTETVLYFLSKLLRAGRIPRVPIYLNSPMAVDAAEIYRGYPQEHRLDRDELRRMYELPTLVRDADESRLLNLRGGPMIILSASGMLTGGRILHHLVSYGGDRRNAIILTGYQAGGTRGSALLAGERTLRIFGEDVPIEAEVVSIDGLSAHADADELVDWVAACPEPPEVVYPVHGERQASDALRARLSHSLGLDVRIPEHLQRVRV